MLECDYPFLPYGGTFQTMALEGVRAKIDIDYSNMLVLVRYYSQGIQRTYFNRDFTVHSLEWDCYD